MQHTVEQWGTRLKSIHNKMEKKNRIASTILGTTCLDYVCICICGSEWVKSSN